jgi:hypothetical protein
MMGRISSRRVAAIMAIPAAVAATFVVVPVSVAYLPTAPTGPSPAPQPLNQACSQGVPIWRGAQVSPTENVYDVRGNCGGRFPTGVPLRGAAVQLVKENSVGNGGSDTATFYYGTATVVTAGTFTNSTPNASGIVTFRESGRYVRGTGFYKGIRGTYRASWILNTKNGQLRFVVTSYARNRP